MNNNTLDGPWFTEICQDQHAAFSMAITEKLHSETTPFQTIDIYATKSFGHLMVIDGYIMLTQRDNFLYHEMMTHPCLFTHNNPKNIAIIGGGDCGTLREVLKHPGVNKVTQIEIDERVTRVAEKYFPELCASNQDSRAEFFFGDGIKWMEEAENIDIIIVDSTDPIGPAEGLFQKPFYESCYAALNEGGILIQQSESPFYHLDLIKSMSDAMKSADFSETRTFLYPQVVYPSGTFTATMAGKNCDLQQYRKNDIANKTFDTVYYNLSMHEGTFAQPEFMKVD